MTIKLAHEPETKHEVDVHLIQREGGYKKVPITVKYRVLKRSELRNTISSLNDGNLSVDDLLRRDVKDVIGAFDEDGKELEFSSELMDELLELTPYFKALDKGWHQVQTHSDEIGEKN